MNDWLEHYEELMRRSRVVSMLGAGIMLGCIVLEGFGSYVAISQAEIELTYDIEFLKGLFLVLAVALAFTMRIVMFTGRRPYWQIGTSWLMASAVGYVYYSVSSMSSFTRDVDCVSEGAKICFSVVDITRPDSVASYFPVFAIGSLLRFAVTAGLAAIGRGTLR